MSESVSFSAFDPIHTDVPCRCDECTSGAPVFRYEWYTDQSIRQPKTGFCCRACADKMLDQLQRFESRVWAEEEASLNADDIDTRDLKERLLATFGK